MTVGNHPKMNGCQGFALPVRLLLEVVVEAVLDEFQNYKHITKEIWSTFYGGKIVVFFRILCRRERHVCRCVLVCVRIHMTLWRCVCYIDH
jgi:hypothetical protein